MIAYLNCSTGRTLDLLDVGEIRNLATRRRRAHTQASMRKKLDKVPEGKSPLVSDDEASFDNVLFGC